MEEQKPISALLPLEISFFFPWNVEAIRPVSLGPRVCHSLNKIDIFMGITREVLVLPHACLSQQIQENSKLQLSFSKRECCSRISRDRDKAVDDLVEEISWHITHSL